MPSPIPRLLVRPLAAVALAASLVFSPLASAPARAHSTPSAGTDNFIAALVALGLIGIIIANENGRDGDGYYVPPNKRLPAKCLKTFRTVNGPKTLFGKTCLENNFRWSARLPEQCLRSIRVVRNGHIRIRQAYRPNCLERYGYRVVYPH